MGTTMIDDVKIIELNVIHSKNASLFVFEDINKLFEIKRVFTVTRHDNSDYQRGRHAHKRDQHIVTCPQGSIKFLVSDGKQEKSFILDSPSKAIYIPTYIWTETDYLETNTVVTVYCSHSFDESSYIREYDEFLKILNEKRKKV